MLPTSPASTAGGLQLKRYARCARTKANGVNYTSGGGSALDAGKAVAFSALQSAPLWAFEDIGDNWRRADPAKILPTLAIPTAAGTSSSRPQQS